MNPEVINMMELVGKNVRIKVVKALKESMEIT